jgi:hypothetical protein
MQDSQPNELLLMRYGSPGQSPGVVMMDTEGASMTYEEEVAGIMGQLLMERIDAKQTVQSLEGMCLRRAGELRSVPYLIWRQLHEYFSSRLVRTQGRLACSWV